MAPLGWTQVSGDGVTASVSRTVVVAPDEASVALLLTGDVGVTRQQAIDAVQAAGFTGAALVAMVTAQADYVYPPQEGTQVSFQFAFSVAATDLKDINQKLEAFRKAKPDWAQGFRYQTQMRISDAALEDARQRVTAQLVSDARKRAAALASATGLKLGALVSVSDNACSNSVSGWIGSVAFVSSSAPSDTPGPLVTFSLYAKFAAN
jgi:uncharacterized protein YggE